jgi:hypothetical protein
MTLEHDLLKLARDAMRLLMNGRHFGTGQNGYYLKIISRIEAELSRPKPEQEPVAWIYNGNLHIFDPTDWAEGEVTPLYKEPPINKMPTKIFGPNLEEILNAAGFYRRDVSTKPENVNTSAECVQESDKSIHEPVCDKDPQSCWSIRCQLRKICKNTTPPRKEWVGLTELERRNMFKDVDWDNEPWGYLAYARAIETTLKEKNT